MSKDFIKFRQYLRTKDLSVNEQFLLEYLFELHNDDFGYAYPPLNDIATAFNTTSKNRVSNVIKSLEKKGLLTVERNYKNNRYYIIGIEEFITAPKKTNKNKSNTINSVAKDSNGEVPIEGQLHVDEIVGNGLDYLEENDIEYLANELEISKKQALKIYLEANKDINKILEVFEYSKTQKVNKLVPYLMKLVKVFKSKYKDSKRDLRTRNFTERQYDWGDLEKGLLGW